MITIRHATIDDLDQLLELNAKIFVMNPTFDDDLILDFPFTPQGKIFFTQSITQEDGCCLIAEEAGEMIGYTDGSAKEIPYRKSKYFEINNLGVIPKRKGHGLGKKLLEAVTQWAKNHGYQRIYVNCYAKNDEAVAFYKRNGYSEIDICLEKVI